VIRNLVSAGTASRSKRSAKPVGAENLRHLGRCCADRGRLDPAFGRRGGQVLVCPEVR